MSPSASESLLVFGVQAPFPDWTLVVAEGRHAERFLNSQLTSDVAGLVPGASQQTALLDHRGRLQAFGFLTKRPNRIELLLPSAPADSTVRKLREHVISDDVTLEAVKISDMRLALGAEAVLRACEDGGDSLFPIEIFGSRGFVSWAEDGLDLPAIDAAELEARRVLTGLPRWGAEVDGDVLVHQTTLIDTAISIDKGCFLGQETVAKVASGRGAARAPMLLEVIAGEVDDRSLIGSTFSSDVAEPSGTVLSSARWDGGLFLQAAVVRQLRVRNREIDCRSEGGVTAKVRVHALPYLEAPDPAWWSRQLELRAVEAFGADREDEAVDLYRRAVAVCPFHADAYEGLGVILGRHGRYEEAIELMHRLLEVDPSSVMAHTNLSLYYNQLGRIEDAEREAAEAMRAKMRREREERGDTGTGGAESDSAAADRERRAEMFRQVLEIDPHDAIANFGLGELRVEEGRFGEAVDHLERALSADPRYSAALLALGRAHEGAHNPDAARETYRRGVDIAAARGDLATANKMQERLAMLDGAGTNG